MNSIKVIDDSSNTKGIIIVLPEDSFPQQEGCNVTPDPITDYLIHNNLKEIQGGTESQRYHINLQEYNAIQGANSPSSSNPFVTVADVTDLVTWENISGDQSVIGNAGFTNTAGYITIADVPTPTLQSVTDAGNITTTRFGYETQFGGLVSFSDRGDNLYPAIEFKTHSIGPEAAFVWDGTRFSTEGKRVEGADAVSNNEFTTLGQLNATIEDIPTPTLQSVTESGASTTVQPVFYNGIQSEGRLHFNTAIDNITSRVDGTSNFASLNSTIGRRDGHVAVRSASPPDVSLAYFASLNTSDLTSPRTFTFPDASGTFALVSDLSNGYIPLSQKGSVNGVATLDANGTVPISQLPDSIFGQMHFGGTYDGLIINASSDYPELQGQPLPAASAYEGIYFISTAAYTHGGISYADGDWIVSTGVGWTKVANSDAVTTVFGRNGNIVAVEGDYQAFYPRLSQTYNNPSWINTLAYSKLTGTPDLSVYYNKTEVDSFLANKINVGNVLPSDLGLTDPSRVVVSSNGNTWATITLSNSPTSGGIPRYQTGLNPGRLKINDPVDNDDAVNLQTLNAAIGNISTPTLQNVTDAGSITTTTFGYQTTRGVGTQVRLGELYDDGFPAIIFEADFGSPVSPGLHVNYDGILQFSSRVRGEDAVNNNEYTTLGQLNTMLGSYVPMSGNVTVTSYLGSSNGFIIAESSENGPHLLTAATGGTGYGYYTEFGYLEVQDSASFTDPQYRLKLRHSNNIAQGPLFEIISKATYGGDYPITNARDLTDKQYVDSQILFKLDGSSIVDKRTLDYSTTHSNAFGFEAGTGSFSATYSNFFGYQAGFGASSYSNFFGYQAGYNASSSSYSNFFGYQAGKDVTQGANSNFFGPLAGTGATFAIYSNFFGRQAGRLSENASSSNFFGDRAGTSATNANSSNFFGTQAGNGATDALHSNFFGFNAGMEATLAAYSNFFGHRAGMSFSGNNVGSNNIIIGTNISLPNATENGINIGGVIFGTGANEYAGVNPVTIPQVNGKIGIAVVPSTTSTLIALNDIEVNEIGQGFVLKSPDGTRWRIQVDNAGILSATAL